MHPKIYEMTTKEDIISENFHDDEKELGQPGPSVEVEEKMQMASNKEKTQITTELRVSKVHLVNVSAEEIERMRGPVVRPQTRKRMSTDVATDGNVTTDEDEDMEKNGSEGSVRSTRSLRSQTARKKYSKTAKKTKTDSPTNKAGDKTSVETGVTIISSDEEAKQNEKAKQNEDEVEFEVDVLVKRDP